MHSVGSKAAWRPDDTVLAVSSIRHSNGDGLLEVFEVDLTSYRLLWSSHSLTFDLYACLHRTGLLYGTMQQAHDPLSTNLNGFKYNGTSTGVVQLQSQLCKDQKNQFHLPICGERWLVAITGTNAIQNDILFASRILTDNEGGVELVGPAIHQIETGPILATQFTPNEDGILANTRAYLNDSWKLNLDLDATDYDRSVATEISNECEVHWWGLSDSGMQLLARFRGHQGLTPHDSPFVLFMDSSQDGEYIASGSEDKNVHVWHVSHTNSHQLEGHTDVVNAVSWRPGALGELASASDDCTICVWD